MCFAREKRVWFLCIGDTFIVTAPTCLGSRFCVFHGCSNTGKVVTFIPVQRLMNPTKGHCHTFVNRSSSRCLLTINFP